MTFITANRDGRPIALQAIGSSVFAGLTGTAAATTNAATLLGKEEELGAIAPGYFAGAVAVEGDPLADVNVTINNFRWVMKAGVPVVDKTKPAK